MERFAVLCQRIEKVINKRVSLGNASELMMCLLLSGRTCSYCLHCSRVEVNWAPRPGRARARWVFISVRSACDVDHVVRALGRFEV